MKNLKNLTVFLLTALYCFGSEAQTYQLDNDKSTVEWIGKAAFNSYAPKGTLKSKSGTLIIENKKIKKLTLIIDMKSLHHDNKDLKSHLRNKDFFEVKKYTNAIFKLVEPVTVKQGKVTFIGDMIIKNNTRREQFFVTLDQEVKELKITYEISLDRTKYGVKFNSPSFFKKLKENAIADEFKIKGVLVLTKI